MASISRFLAHSLVALLMALLANPAFADPPGRVGRLADLHGQVWLYDSEAAEWVAALRNRPLTTGDRLSTDGDARAELRIGSSTLRLAGGTELELLQVDDDGVRVQVHNGSLALRLRTHEAAREFELVTAEGRFKPDRAGRYRLDRLDATSSITVWSGQGLFEAPDNAVTLVGGQRADIWNDGRTQYTLVQPQRDAFADQVEASELAEERSVSAKYVSAEMTGVEDLDRYGRWETVPEYGSLWVPQTVVPGWAPYRFGHWAWIRPWGWTWVDDAPWGFAPFHYGRWVYFRNNWAWAPGRWVARPVYAPALVAWVGAPLAGVSVSIRVGPAVGWFPLGPREVYVPTYRSSPTYVRNVNVTHVTNITNVRNIINAPDSVVQNTRYLNRTVPGAMTVVPASVVSLRQPVAPSRVHLTDPRPAVGSRQAFPEASAATVVAAPPVEAPRYRRDAGAGVAPPGALEHRGLPADGSVRPRVPAAPAARNAATTSPGQEALPAPLPALPPMVPRQRPAPVGQPPAFGADAGTRPATVSGATVAPNVQPRPSPVMPADAALQARPLPAKPPDATQPRISPPGPPEGRGGAPPVAVPATVQQPIAPSTAIAPPTRRQHTPPQAVTPPAPVPAPQQQPATTPQPPHRGQPAAATPPAPSPQPAPAAQQPAPQAAVPKTPPGQAKARESRDDAKDREDPKANRR